MYSYDEYYYTDAQGVYQPHFPDGTKIDPKNMH